MRKATSRGRQLPRRGLVAGVAALVAGALAKASERVAQAAGMQGTALICGEINTATNATELIRGPGGTGVTAGLKVTWDHGASIQGAIEGSSENAIGVFGNSINNYGVRGLSRNHPGLVGTSVNNFAIYGAGQGSVGVYGTSLSGANVGVYGLSANNAGVYGVSTNSLGIYGISTNSTGVLASSSSNTNPALYAVQYGAGPAAQFSGNVIVYGNLTVTGAAKSAAVPHPDGSHRRMYCVESPESWFEDYGEARVVNGRATVRLDPDFDAVVRGDNYRVFLTPEGDCKGLYVSDKRPHQFEVRELQGGTSTITFSYRVVAKRRDIEGPRLERVSLPPQPNVPTVPPPPPPPRL